MIDIAREQTPDSMPIRYVVGDAADVGDAVLRDERFDVVLANYLLNYAKTEAELTSYLTAIRRALVPATGVLVAANDYSEPETYDASGLQPESLFKHGFRKSMDPATLGVDGAPVLVEVFVPEPPHAGWPRAAEADPPGTPVIDFYNFHLSRETHDRAFKAAGFREPVERHFLSISPEGIEKCGDWFDDLVASRTVVYYRATCEV